jgi:uncharacterized caspase-like protein
MYEERFVKVPTEATRLPIKANIVDEIENITSAASEEDEVWFYFSGHGFEREAKSYLVPSDGRPQRAAETLRRIGLSR